MTLTLLAPVFRYSATRDAYVLRGIGNATGPVLVARARRERRQRSAAQR